MNVTLPPNLQIVDSCQQTSQIIHFLNSTTVEKLKKLAGQKSLEEDDYINMLSCGNGDDIYNVGFTQGGIFAARDILDEIGINY